MSDVVEQSPVTEDPAAPPVVEEAAEVQPEAERDVETDTLEIPDSSQEGGKAKYVPAAALAGARRELKELKAELAGAKEGSAKADRLEREIANLQAQFNQVLPLAQAYQAAVQQPKAPVVEDDTELQELAQSLDLWTPEGKPDTAKAKTIQAFVARTSQAQAKQAIAPIEQRNTQQLSQYNLQRALATDIHGEKPDPSILKALWSQLDPSVTASEEQAKLLVVQALGMTRLQPGKARAANGTFAPAAPKEEIPAPLHVEKAGGRDTPNSAPMSAAEKAIAKDMGLTEAQYLERARSAPWLR